MGLFWSQRKVIYYRHNETGVKIFDCRPLVGVGGGVYMENSPLSSYLNQYNRLLLQQMITNSQPLQDLPRVFIYPINGIDGIPLYHIVQEPMIQCPSCSCIIRWFPWVYYLFDIWQLNKKMGLLIMFYFLMVASMCKRNRFRTMWKSTIPLDFLFLTQWFKISFIFFFLSFYPYVSQFVPWTSHAFFLNTNLSTQWRTIQIVRDTLVYMITRRGRVCDSLSSTSPQIPFPSLSLASMKFSPILFSLGIEYTYPWLIILKKYFFFAKKNKKWF